MDKTYTTRTLADLEGISVRGIRKRIERLQDKSGITKQGRDWIIPADKIHLLKKKEGKK
jgi:hypothetical protein